MAKSMVVYMRAPLSRSSKSGAQRDKRGFGNVQRIQAQWRSAVFNVTVSLAILAACANLIVLILFLILFFDSFDLVLAIETIEEEGRERGRSMRMAKNDLWSHSFLFPPTLIRAKSLPWPIKRIEPGECS